MPVEINLTYLGNKEIIKLHKTAFLCSRRCPADVVLKSLDWAKGMKDRGKCVISCFHSHIEKDVFDILLRGTQPLILMLARGMKKKWPAEIRNAVSQERLLIISPFDESVTKITTKTAHKRNQIMVDMADEVFLAYSIEDGNLSNLLQSIKNKKISSFR
jgi:predicted Rossmann fold nucleotide-binding protein DprA/Smf involved in DNA uptake